MYLHYEWKVQVWSQIPDNQITGTVNRNGAAFLRLAPSCLDICAPICTGRKILASFLRSLISAASAAQTVSLLIQLVFLFKRKRAGDSPSHERNQLEYGVMLLCFRCWAPATEGGQGPPASWYFHLWRAMLYAIHPGGAALSNGCRRLIPWSFGGKRWFVVECCGPVSASIKIQNK